MIYSDPVYVNATTLDDVWFQLLYQINEHGRRYKIDNGSYAGDIRLEFDFASGFINKPHERPLAPRMPEGSTLPRPTDDDAIEQYFANYLMDPNLADNEEYRYATWINGQMLPYPDYCYYVKCPEITSVTLTECQNMLQTKNITKCPLGRPNTQLEWIIDHFKSKGHGNNHCYITVGDKYSSLSYDKPYNNESERGTSPCLRGIDFKIKQDTLITGVEFRSWDLFSGFPENMGGITLLNEYVANELGVQPGPLAFSSMGLHCYGFQLEVLKQRLRK
jgi:thymidylate synthase